MGFIIKILNLAIMVFIYCQIFPETLSWKTYFSQWIQTRLIVPEWMIGSSLSTVKVNKCIFSTTREAALRNRFSCTQSINKAELVFRRGWGGGRLCKLHSSAREVVYGQGRLLKILQGLNTLLISCKITELFNTFRF